MVFLFVKIGIDIMNIIFSRFTEYCFTELIFPFYSSLYLIREVTSIIIDDIGNFFYWHMLYTHIYIYI